MPSSTAGLTGSVHTAKPLPVASCRALRLEDPFRKDTRFIQSLRPRPVLGTLVKKPQSWRSASVTVSTMIYRHIFPEKFCLEYEFGHYQ